MCDNRVIYKVTLCFIPYLLCFRPLSPLPMVFAKLGIFLLNLGMKCCVSAFNAQGSRVIIIVVQVGAVKIYVTAAQALRRKKQRMKLSLPPKLVEKLVWVPVISFCKIFIPSYAFDALLCRNWPFSPSNCLTLWITLICRSIALQTVDCGWSLMSWM